MYVAGTRNLHNSGVGVGVKAAHNADRGPDQGYYRQRQDEQRSSSELGQQDESGKSRGETGSDAADEKRGCFFGVHAHDLQHVAGVSEQWQTEELRNQADEDDDETPSGVDSLSEQVQIRDIFRSIDLHLALRGVVLQAIDQTVAEGTFASLETTARSRGSLSSSSLQKPDWTFW